MVELREIVKLEKPLIIAINEVMPKNINKNREEQDYSISGFSLHRWTRGRGINIWTHKSIDKSVSIPPTRSNTTEAGCIEIRLQGGDSLMFSCVYRSGTQSEENNKELNKFLVNQASRSTHLNICGDFNYKNINWQLQSCSLDEESNEHKFLNAVQDSFLHQHVSEPTRSRGSDNPTLLDLVFTNEDAMINEVSHHSPLGKSDHDVILWNYECYTEKSSRRSVIQWQKADFESMREDLAQHQWQTYEDVDLIWNEVKGKLLALRDRYVPTVHMGDRPSWEDKGDFPASPELREMIREKTKAHRKWIRRVNWPDGEELRQSFIRCRNKVTAISRREKRNFEKAIALRTSKEDTKPFWMLARKRLKTSKGVAPLLKDVTNPGSLTFDDTEKAEALQRQFISVCTREPDGEIPSIEEKTQERLDTAIITEAITLKQLKALQVNKSCGPDGLHPLLLRELADPLAQPLTRLFNASQTSGVLPRDWKTAQVSPIFKKGATNLPANYRPVSLTCILCKVMESVVRKTIIDFCTKHNLLTNRQFGFMGGRSTTLQLLNFLDYCGDIMAERGVTDVVYLDFAKAFDSVPHRRLIGKLQSYGINGALLRWIEAFLIGRVQKVCVNGNFSSEETVLSGIPQGSVLGPLLFVIYINDLPDNLNCEALLFADDTKVYTRVKNRADAERLQENLKKIREVVKRLAISVPS